MRTKTLLIAAAALAATIITSEAQVYSANIVGYSSLTLPATFSQITIPFQVGVSNGANEIFGTNLPDGTSINVWNPNTLKYVTSIYDTQGGFGSSPNNWYQGDDQTPTNPPVLTVGLGFFISPTAPITNVFSGAVAVNVGATNNVNLPATFVLVGSPIPSAGAVTNSVIDLTTNLPDGTAINIWNPTTLKYTTYIYDTQGGFGSSPNNWYQGDDQTPTNPPSITVGQGFFIAPSAPFTWSQVLPSN
jgi:hypothetical protein